MRVGTFNLRYDTPADAKIAPWSERVHEVVAAFHNMNCDVVGTQEGLLHQLNDLPQGPFCLSGERDFLAERNS
jgi:hypothetical protein